jgi:hypothetical protein
MPGASLEGYQSLRTRLARYCSGRWLLASSPVDASALSAIRRFGAARASGGVLFEVRPEFSHAESHPAFDGPFR